jgi:hypothetical protein
MKIYCMSGNGGQGDKEDEIGHEGTDHDVLVYDYDDISCTSLEWCTSYDRHC